MSERVLVRTKHNLTYAGTVVDSVDSDNSIIISPSDGSILFVIPKSECRSLIKDGSVIDIKCSQTGTIPYGITRCDLDYLAIHLLNGMTFTAKILGYIEINNNLYFVCSQSEKTRVLVLIKTDSVVYSINLMDEKIEAKELLKTIYEARTES